MVNIKLIEELRKKHHYSQEQVAKLLGYESRTAYNYKIKGARDFSIEDIVKLCNLFQLQVNELIIIEKVGK